MAVGTSLHLLQQNVAVMQAEHTHVFLQSDTSPRTEGEEKQKKSHLQRSLSLGGNLKD